MAQPLKHPQCDSGLHVQLAKGKNTSLLVYFVHANNELVEHLNDHLKLCFCRTMYPIVTSVFLSVCNRSAWAQSL